MRIIWIAWASVLAGTSMLPGQDVGTRARVYQVFGPAIAGRALDEGFTNRLVRGKPFSATEERKSIQVLGDGTRIENNQTNRLFRDSEGRTRVEEMNGTATIFDPVTNMRTELNTSTRTARKLVGILLANRLSAPLNPGTTQGVMAETTENLGPQNVNGVTAQGVRTTMTIPKGQIGNDREIKVLTERWTSSDLQMLIKSTNSDPRFGSTSYQLTGIVEREPDASLFQVPPGYTETRAPGLALPSALGGRSASPGTAVPGGRGGGRGGRGGTQEPAEQNGK